MVARIGGDIRIGRWWCGPPPSDEETRERGVIFEHDLIVIQMFTDSVGDFLLGASVADAEGHGYLLELRFLFWLEGARVHGCCHRVRGRWWWFGVNMTGSININKSRRHEST